MKKPAPKKRGTSKHKKKFSTKNKNKLIKVTINQVVPKYIFTLRILVKRPLVELEAFRLYGETCLHSTISTLSNKKGIRFHRKSEAHINRSGGISYFTRYTIFKEDKGKAYAMIKLYKATNDG